VIVHLKIDWFFFGGGLCFVVFCGGFFLEGASWPWLYGSWIYNYQCNQCLSPLMLWVRILIRAWCTTLC